MNKPKEKTELEKAQEMVVKEHQKRIQNCNKEIDIILKKYGFTLQVSSRIALTPLRGNNDNRE